MLLSGTLNSCTRVQFGLVRSSRFLPVRQIHQSAKQNAEQTVEQGTAGVHRPDKWDKRMLVWMKKYPNAESIPATVSSATMDKIRNKVRIRVNILLCILTGLFSFTIYQYGKRKTLAGEGIFATKS